MSGFTWVIWYFDKAQPDIVEITYESLEETHVRLLGSFAQEKHLRSRSLFAIHYSLCCPGETIEIWSRIVVDGSDLQCITVTVCWHGERFNHPSEVPCVCVLTGGWRGPPCSSSLCLESTTLCLPSPRRISASGSDWCLSWAWAPSRYWASDFIVGTLVLYFKKHLLGDYFTVPIPSELAS